MAFLTENHIEAFALKLLSYSGYSCYYGPEIAPGGSNPLRSSLASPILEGVLQEAVDRLNPSVPATARQEAVRQVLRVSSPDLISANETFHQLLTCGVPVSYQKDGSERGDRVWLIDFNRPESNEFTAVDQFTFVENNANKRPDIVLFVNGLPLVVIELKNAADESTTIKTAFQQLQTYKHVIPALMAYNGLLVVSDGLEARTGSLSADFSRFSVWKSENGTEEASHLKSQLEVLVNSMLNKATLLDLVRFFTVFEKMKKQDEQGQLSVSTVKKVAAYHQYYAVNKAVASTMQAARRNDEQRGKGGVVWHTQGSGKSLSMVFFSGKIVHSLDNPTIVVLTASWAGAETGG